MADSAGVSRTQIEDRANAVNRTVIPWTSASDGTASVTADVDGVITRVQTKPGTPAPTSYGVIILDSAGQDIMGGALTSRSATVPESMIPEMTGSGGTNKYPVAVAEQLTINISGAGNAKQGSVIIYHR